MNGSVQWVAHNCGITQWATPPRGPVNGKRGRRPKAGANRHSRRFARMPVRRCGRPGPTA